MRRVVGWEAGGRAHPHQPGGRRRPSTSTSGRSHSPGKGSGSRMRAEEKEATVSRCERPSPRQAVSIFLWRPARERLAEPPHPPLSGHSGRTSAQGHGEPRPFLLSARAPQNVETGFRLRLSTRRGLPYLGRPLRDPTGHIIKNLSLFHLRGLKQCRQLSGRKPTVTRLRETWRQLCVTPSPPGRPPPHKGRGGGGRRPQPRLLERSILPGDLCVSNNLLRAGWHCSPRPQPAGGLPGSGSRLRAAHTQPHSEERSSRPGLPEPGGGGPLGHAAPLERGPTGVGMEERDRASAALPSPGQV